MPSSCTPGWSRPPASPAGACAASRAGRCQRPALKLAHQDWRLAPAASSGASATGQQPPAASALSPSRPRAHPAVRQAERVVEGQPALGHAAQPALHVDGAQHLGRQHLACGRAAAGRPGAGRCEFALLRHPAPHTLHPAHRHPLHPAPPAPPPAASCAPSGASCADTASTTSRYASLLRWCTPGWRQATAPVISAVAPLPALSSEAWCCGHGGARQGGRRCCC
jgi:hypothetical protein